MDTARFTPNNTNLLGLVVMGLHFGGVTSDGPPKVNQEQAVPFLVLLSFLLEVDCCAAETSRLCFGLSLTLQSALLKDAEVVEDYATAEVLGDGHFVSVELVAAKHVQGSVSTKT